eukprot:11130899-Karenia_brevis.AAC.1
MALRLDVIIFSSAISACEKSRQWQQATTLRVDVVIFSSAKTACDGELVAWQVGLLGVRVGEASNPGPPYVCP